MSADALRRPLPERFDWLLMGAALALALLGLVMVASASLQIGESLYDNAFYFLTRHGVYLGVSLVVALGVYQLVSMSWLERMRGLALPGAILVLLLLFVPGLGREVNGSLRWIALPGFTLQPSEFAKLGFVIYLAGYVSQRRTELLTTWRGFLVPVALLGLLAVLLLLQPDFGAVVVIGIACMGMLFLAQVPLHRYLLLTLAVVAAAGAIAVAQPYRMARLMSFMDPWADQFGSGYQLVQSLIAFGRGHLFGVGLGNSVQKLFYLPEAHTDFVYAVMAEELGLIGNLLMIGLFVLLVYRIFRLGARLELQGWLFQSQLVYGIALIFASQALINIGVNMGVLPTKGLTLPFVSYGGSSLLICAVMLALVLRAGHELRQFQQRAQRRLS